MLGMQQEATDLAKQAEVKNGFHLLRKSNALREKAVGKLRSFKLWMMSKQDWQRIQYIFQGSHGP